MLAAGALVLIVVATIIGRAYTALGNGKFDSRLFLYVGQQWADGVLPYRDLWDNKPPAVFALTRLADAIGTPLMFLAIVEGLVVVGTAACVWLLLGALGVRHLVRWFGAVVAAIALNLGAMSDGDLPTELLLALPATAAAVCLVRAHRHTGNTVQLCLLAGALCGVATLIKTPGLALLFAYTAAMPIAVVARKVPLKEAGARLLLAWAGAALAFAGPVGYFAAHGAALEMLDATFTYNLHYGYTSRPNPFKTGLALLIAALPIASVVGLALPAVAMAMRRCISELVTSVRASRPVETQEPRWSDAPVGALLVLWFAADVSGAMAGGRAYPHYLIAVMPSAAVLAGVTMETVLHTTSRGGLAALALGSSVVLPLLSGLAGDVRKVRELMEHPPRAYWGEASRVISERACVGDRLFTWEYVPGVAQSTRLRPASVIASGHYLFDSKYAVARFMDRLRSDLANDPPAYLVVKAQPEPAQTGLLRVERSFVESLAVRQYRVILPAQPGSEIVVYERVDHSCENRVMPRS